jgi:hypothetical protein
MRESVIRRLESFGYVANPAADGWLLGHVIDGVANEIKNSCNIDAVPDGLRQVAVDMACGEFLAAKRGGGQELNIDMEKAVKTIKEGDTQITYAVADDAITLDGLIRRLTSGGRPQFATYRRFVW